MDINKFFKRREFLKGLAISGAGIAVGTFRPSFAHAADGKSYLVKTTGSFVKSREYEMLSVRALGLEPVIRLKSQTSRTLRISINNVWSDRLTFFGPSIEAMEVSGRTVRMDVYLPAGEEVVLESSMKLLPGEILNFCAFSDTHLGVPEAEEHFSRVQKYVNMRMPHFVVDAGDIIDFDDAKQWQVFAEKDAGLKMPLFSTIGNHDSYLSNKLYEEYLGDLFHGFSFNGSQFLFLDNAQKFNNATLVMDGNKPMAQWEWLEEKLKQEADNRFVFFHFPVFGVRSMLDPMYVKDSNLEARTVEVSKMVDLFKTSGVKHVCYGHLHSAYREEKDGITYQRLGGGGGSKASHTDDKNVNFSHFFIDENGVRCYTTNLYVDDAKIKAISFCELPEKVHVGSKIPLIVHAETGSEFKYFGLDVPVSIKSGTAADIKDGKLHARWAGKITLSAAYKGYEVSRTVKIS